MDFTKHPSTSSSSSSSSHDHDTASTSHSTSMPMTFFTSSTTPLFATSWTPTQPGHYAGTCVFLIVLAVSSRVLAAWKNVLEQRWARRDVVNTAKSTGADDDEETAAVEAFLGWGATPWRWSVDLPRSAVTTLASAIGYFMMLAVMTMNVGYFLSVLGGIFMGELVCGRYIRS